ncbi:hypothetical protein [Pseudomonas sp. SST3]|uniref:hypothetical protein n=1 Tax=Pseudomonas sp. SST3 TaxID=2267882 RepID=UPI002696CC74
MPWLNDFPLALSRSITGLSASALTGCCGLPSTIVTWGFICFQIALDIVMALLLSPW